VKDNLFLNFKIVNFAQILIIKMETASFTGVLKTILYFIVGYYIIKFLARLLFPIVVRKVVSKAEESFKQQYQSSQQNNNYTSQQNRSVKDEISAEDAKSNNPKSTKKVGEYVDYEEIE
jgi:type IV secretory pathway VirB3-like protein